MPYSTANQVRKRARQLTSSVRGDTELEDYISMADAYIDAMLENAYAGDVPFSSTPTLISHISRDLAASYLLDELYGEDNPTTSEFAVRLERRASSILKKLAEGTLRLTITGHDDHDRPLSTTYDTDSDTATEQIFTRGDQTTWELPEDFDTLDDDIDDRVNG